MALLLICGSGVVKRSSSDKDTRHTFIRGVGSDSSELDHVLCVCVRVCVSLLHAPCVFLGVFLFGFVMLLVSLFFSWPVHYSRGSLPGLPGTARPSWREMPASNYTQVDGAHTQTCAHGCVCLLVTLFIFVTVLSRNPTSVLAHF